MKLFTFLTYRPRRILAAAAIISAAAAVLGLFPPYYLLLAPASKPAAPAITVSPGAVDGILPQKRGAHPQYRFTNLHISDGHGDCLVMKGGVTAEFNSPTIERCRGKSVDIEQ